MSPFRYFKGRWRTEEEIWRLEDLLKSAYASSKTAREHLITPDQAQWARRQLPFLESQRGDLYYQITTPEERREAFRLNTKHARTR
jgi:hypothetical protein